MSNLSQHASTSPPASTSTASSETSDAGAPLRQRGVQFVEEPEVKVHVAGESNADGEGLRRLHGTRDQLQVLPFKP